MALAGHADSPSASLRWAGPQLWYTIAGVPGTVTVQVSGVTASGMSLAVWVNLDCVIPQNYSYLAGDSVALTLPSSAATRFHIMVYGTTDPFNLLVTCGSVADTVGGAGCRNVQASVTTDLWPTQASWYISPSVPLVSGGGYRLADTVFTKTVCLPPGQYSFQALDSNGNGWSDGFTGGFQLFLEGLPLVGFTTFNNAYRTVTFVVPEVVDNCGCHANATCMVGLNMTRFCSCDQGFLGDGNLSCVADECARATPIQCGATIKAYTSPHSYIPRRIAGVLQSAPSRWFYLDVDDPGIVLTVTTCSNTSFPHRLSVFAGWACSNLSQSVPGINTYAQTCPSGSGLVAQWTALAAGRYYVMVYGYSDDLVGNFTIQTTCTDPDEGSCYDLTGWHDQNNFTCSDYVAQGWCSNGWYGSNWNKSWGFFSKFAIPNGTPANQGCCSCGKYHQPTEATSATDCLLGNWGDWSACTAVDDQQCRTTRQRAVLQLPYGGGAACDVTQQQQGCACAWCAVDAWSSWSPLSDGLVVRGRSPTAPDGLESCPPVGEANCTADCPAKAVGSLLVQVFGANNDGQLGQGDNDARGTADNFVDLGFPVVITDVACGQYHTAVLADGLLFVFGGNDMGQLGLGDRMDRLTPRLLFPQQNENGSAATLLVAAVALGAKHSAVLMQSGAVLTFGDNGEGQLGLGTTTVQLTPQPVDLSSLLEAGESITALALGGQSSALLTSWGDVVVFGYNAFGQLMYRSTGAAQSTPRRLGVRGARGVAVGDEHSALQLSDGTWQMSGSNLYNKIAPAPQSSGATFLRWNVTHVPNLTAVVPGYGVTAYITAAGNLFM
eukprot:EG_transcript_637